MGLAKEAADHRTKNIIIRALIPPEGI